MAAGEDGAPLILLVNSGIFAASNEPATGILLVWAEEIGEAADLHRCPHLRAPLGETKDGDESAGRRCMSSSRIFCQSSFRRPCPKAVGAAKRRYPLWAQKSNEAERSR
jgi:hypothetical protein